MRKVLALRLLTTLMVLSLLSTASFVVPVHAQEQYSISTDKLVYNVGETVTIYVSPAPPNFGVYPWIVVTKPDQSQVRLDLELAGLGQATTRLVADIVGQYTVDLWFQAVGPNATPRLMATCYFQAGGNQTLKFQPTIQERLAAFSVSIAITIVVIVAALWLTRKRRERVSILGRFVRFLGIGVIAYVIGGIAYWTAGELFPRRPPPRDRRQPSNFVRARSSILAHDGLCGSGMGRRHASRCRCGLRRCSCDSCDMPLVDQDIES